MHPIFRTATSGAGAGAAKGGTTQAKLYGNVIKTESAHLCHIAIADFICSNALPFTIAECPKFRKLLQVAKNLPSQYRPPNRHLVGGNLLDSLFKSSYKDLMQSVTSESEIFGRSIFGDGTTIKNMGAGGNALLEEKLKKKYMGFKLNYYEGMSVMNICFGFVFR